MTKRVCILKDTGRGHAVLMGELSQPAEKEIQQIFSAGLLNGIENVTAGSTFSPFDDNPGLMRMTIAIWSAGYADKIDPSAVEWEVVDVDALAPKETVPKVSVEESTQPRRQLPTPAADALAQDTVKVAVACPKCRSGYRVAQSVLGKKAKCKHCSTVFVLQESSTSDDTVASSGGTTEYLGMKDERIARLINAVASQVTITQPGSCSIRRMEATVLFAKELGELHREYPRSAELHYAYAAALEVNSLSEEAARVLEECTKAHPNFWLAKVVSQRQCLSTWNPFLCSEFDPSETTQVHEAIDSVLSRTLLLTTRDGMLPRATVFQRDGSDEFDVSVLQSCKIDFLTTISPVTDPQVVAINICIYDDPTNPYRTEILFCPFSSLQDERRFACELFVRQDDFDFVIVDGRGKVKYRRGVEPSQRMQAVHATLAHMLDEIPSQEIPESRYMQAIRQHTTMVNPNTLQY
jgi:predicted Zn finger-like uncharacterized protein